MTDIFQREVIDSFRGDHEFLSNFYREMMEYDGHVWATAEHAYQAAKCSKQEEYDLFLNPLLTAGQAKRLGRHISIWKNWDSIKFSTMQKIVEAKFEEDTPIATKLLATGDAILIEGNTWGDRYWGMCNGEGSNHLGQILMHRRDQLRLMNER
ncbi:NADAR family protein [Xanthomonas phage BUDD]|nr:NADAR family protein [Xanthomonas phage BUDD]